MKPSKSEAPKAKGPYKEGLYVYCFAPGDLNPDLTVPGVDGRENIHRLEIDQVRAFFSDIQLAQFQGETGKRNLGDLSWLGQRALRHERVIEQIMQSGQVLPVRFATIFTSREGLTEFLTRHARVIRQFFTRLRDKEEWSIKGFTDLEKTRTCVLKSDPVLSDSHQQLPPSPGRRYFQEKRLQTETQKKVTRWSGDLADQVRREIKNRVVDLYPLRLQEPAPANPKTRMILNYSVLVARAGVSDLRDHLLGLEKKFGREGLLFNLTGPWPPYTFCPALPETPP
jgi:hypothetical protein